MYTFIVNPNARSGLGKKVWDSVEVILKERNIEYEILFTKYQNHATRLVEKLTSDGQEHTIVILGGDGAINEVVNGITDLSKVTLGYIPIGSGNDFARAMHLSADPTLALEHILQAYSIKSLNIGKLTYKEKTRRFVVSTGLGFDAGVCHQVAVSKWKKLLNKLKLGKLSYTSVALHRMITLNPKPMDIILDGEQRISFQKVYFGTAMNLPYEGGGFKFCPKANGMDDYLDVIVIADLPKLKALALLPTAFIGQHVHFKGVYIYRCKTVEFISEPALPVHTDGEPIFLQRDMTASLESEKLRVICS